MRLRGARGLRILLIHAKEFRYRVREKALEVRDELEGYGERSYENVLVAFTAVEEADERDIEGVSERASAEIVDVANKVKASAILVYPYAHLSQRLAEPAAARRVLQALVGKLRATASVPVDLAPFGWYKEFYLHCLGHPLSELSRTIEAAAERPKALATKKYYVLTPDGKLVRPEEYPFEEGDELKAVVDKEVFKKVVEGARGRVHEYLRKFGFEWEELSDRGHMRYEPHAAVMLEAVAQYSWQLAKSLGIPVFRVHGTNMFSLKAEAVKEHAELFGERMYEVRIDGDVFVLRFAACHQQFSILKDWTISYRDLPFGIFEVADSYRYEQTGELILGFRLRRFHMPDLHILCRDLEEAKRLALRVRDRIVEEARKLGREYQAIYNVAEDFLRDHFDYIVELVKAEGRPVLLTVYPAGLYYWVINVEYVIVDELGRPREIATWQIDVGNAKRFNIKYVDEGGHERYPVIIHTALIGSVERYLYMVFDTVAREEAKGRVPTLPLWLSPTQVRIIPVSKEYLAYAEDIAKRLAESMIRADVDDRDEPLGKKIRDAGVEWIPFIVVIGEREVKTGTINVRFREEQVQKVMTVEELLELLNSRLRYYPRVDSALPIYLSKRPTLAYMRQVRGGPR